MNLPIRALSEIKAFARPMTRPDWRNCKSREAKLIKVYDEKLRERHARRVKVMYRNRHDGQREKFVFGEICRWTLYGRRRIFKEPDGWVLRVITPREVPTMDKPELYLYRFKWIICGHPEWTLVNDEWVPLTGKFS